MVNDMNSLIKNLFSKHTGKPFLKECSERFLEKREMSLNTIRFLLGQHKNFIFGKEM